MGSHAVFSKGTERDEVSLLTLGTTVESPPPLRNTAFGERGGKGGNLQFTKGGHGRRSTRDAEEVLLLDSKGITLFRSKPDKREKGKEKAGWSKETNR